MRYNNRTMKSLLPKDTVTESPPIMKIIARFREEFKKKVGKLLKGGGNKELTSSFSTSPSAQDLEEQEAHEQKVRKWLVFELKSKLLPLFSHCCQVVLIRERATCLSCQWIRKKLKR